MSDRSTSRHGRNINKRILVIGLGNPDRRDDSVGLLIARRLKTLVPGWTTVAESSGDMTELLELWCDFDSVILVDAMQAGEVPGFSHWFDASALDLTDDAFVGHSTHAFGLSQAIAMARALGELPREVHVVGVQGADFTAGTTVSPGTEMAIESVVESILAHVCAKEGTHA